MDRVIISPINKSGKVEVSVNPDLLYLDSSAWIDIFEEYLLRKEKIIEGIAKAVGNNGFRILISVVNFFELIGTKGDISKNFSADHLKAIDNIHLISAHQPPIIIEQEIFRFLGKKKQGIRILDANNVALKSMMEGSEQRKQRNTTWFLEKRRWWDEINERDRILNLEADLYELSGFQPSFAQVIKSFGYVISGPIQMVMDKKSELVKNKLRYRGKKEIPSEEKEILRYAGNRITTSITGRYGKEKVSMLISNPSFIFTGKRNIIMDFTRGAQLTFSKLMKQLPGLYWQAKICYYNYYHGLQRTRGQMGDRNHAVYIPYSNYFATSDRIIVNALKSEYTVIFTKNNLHLFKIT